MSIKSRSNEVTSPLVENLNPIDKAVFYGTVSLTGASVMMIELLGTRVIGPYYGVSLIVWSSLLSVSLLALAMGYYVGGAFADRGDRLRLPHALFLAAVLTGLIPFIDEPVQLGLDPLGLRWGALSSAFVLFTPPLFFLGMAGPFIIRLATSRVEAAGSTAGNVYAISTVGSVLGTLILGFYLLPIFGTQAILYSLSLILCLLSLAIAQYENKRFSQKHKILAWGATTAILVIFFAFHLLQKKTEHSQYTVQFEQETHYGWVRVVDEPEKNIRWLMSDASTIGAQDLHGPKGLLTYQTVVRMMPWFKQDSESVLLIGLGSGHLVNEFAEFGLTTDSIEIDPAVAYAAKEYFSYKPTGELWVEDARYQIKKINKKYDLIVHDCFTGGAEPFHLLSTEMITELKGMLKPGGILAVNFVGFTEPKKMKPVRSIALTLDKSFEHRRVFLSQPGEAFNDFIFLVSDAELAIQEREGSERALAWMSEREVQVGSENAVLITDDYNPLEYMQIAKAEYYRNMLISRVDKSILFR